MQTHPAAWPGGYPDMFTVPLAGKWCNTCKRMLPVSAFGIQRRNASGVASNCLECKRAHKWAWTLRNRKPPAPTPTEKCCGRCKVMLPISAFDRRGGSEHGLRSQCRECHRAAKRRYNEAHRAERAAKSRAYYRENTEACKERIRRSNAANPEKYRAIHSIWKKQNKDAVNASTHLRRARINGGSWTADEWRRLKARHDFRCLMCNRQEVTDDITLCFDHVVPLAVGGLNIISNGQPLCRSCNSVKHTKVLDLRS